MTDPVVNGDELGAMDSPASGSSSLYDALAVEGLIQANNESNENMQRLVESVRAETRARDRKVEVLEKNQHQLRVLSFVGVVAICCLIVMAVFNAYNTTATRRNAERAAQIALAVKQINQTMLDCTNGTGECGKKNAASLNYALNEIKKYELTVIYCARTNPQPLDPKGSKFRLCIEELYPNGPKLNSKDQ